MVFDWNVFWSLIKVGGFILMVCIIVTIWFRNIEEEERMHGDFK